MMDLDLLNNYYSKLEKYKYIPLFNVDNKGTIDLVYFFWMSSIFYFNNSFTYPDGLSESLFFLFWIFLYLYSFYYFISKTNKYIKQSQKLKKFSNSKESRIINTILKKHDFPKLNQLSKISHLNENQNKILIAIHKLSQKNKKTLTIENN